MTKKNRNERSEETHRIGQLQQQPSTGARPIYKKKGVGCVTDIKQIRFDLAAYLTWPVSAFVPAHVFGNDFQLDFLALRQFGPKTKSDRVSKLGPNYFAS